jgi:hypothetical protein
MPEWLKHIKKDNHKTYCGLWSQGMWLFQSLEHAELAILQEQRLVPCKKCLMAVRKVEVSVVGLRKTCDHYIKTNLCRFLKNAHNEPAICDLTATNPCVGFHEET